MNYGLDMRVIEVITMRQTTVNKSRLPDGELITVTDDGALRGTSFFSDNVPYNISVRQSRAYQAYSQGIK